MFLSKIFGTKSDREIKKLSPIINQINQDFNTSCTQEQFFNLQKNALENGKCLA